MEVDLALLADAATIDASGKLNVLGVFDRLGGMGLPLRHPRMAMVLRFTAGVQEAGRHVVEIALKDPDGEEMVRVDGEMHLAPGPHALGGGVRVPHILNMDGLVFPKAGSYAFDVRVDDEHHVTIPLVVASGSAGAEA